MIANIRIVWKIGQFTQKDRFYWSI